jgi:hypothetical protein
MATADADAPSSPAAWILTCIFLLLPADFLASA